MRFGRKAKNTLYAFIVFGVLNGDSEGEEYVSTNNGDVFRVMNTIAEIVRIFMKEHPKMMAYEFNAIANAHEMSKSINSRMLLYKRFLPKIFDSSWTFNINGSNALVERKFS